jgi:hypothetical protein
MSESKQEEPVWTPATMGRKGGLARVKKGASMWTKKRRRELGKQGAAKRWGARNDRLISATSSAHIGPQMDPSSN